MTPADAVLCLGRSLLGHPSLGPRPDSADPADDYYHRLQHLLLVRLVPDLARRRGLPAPPDLRPCPEAQRLLPEAIDCPSLGELRQQLLELHPTLDVRRGRFDLTPATHRRKASGAYYTPAVLVECLLDSALAPVVDAALGRPDPEAALLGLRVCDPACGDGQFLVAAARRVAAALASVRGGRADDALAEVVARCVYGVDRDPLAALAARVNLWLEKGDPACPLSCFEAVLRCGDSLLEGPFPAGGFDVVVGNPPWERVKVLQKEWFAARRPEIARAPDAATRRRLVEELRRSQPALHAAYQAERRRALDAGLRLRQSGRYRLSARGDLNLYGPFLELGRSLLRPGGRLGMVLPSGLATDATLADLFDDLLRSGQVVRWLDFHNRGRLFPGVQGNVKFGLLTLSADPQPAFTAAAQLAHPGDLEEQGRTWTLTAEDLGRLNPQTRHCPVFASARDAELVLRLHRRVGVLLPPASNPWGLRLATPFHMTNDAALFRTRESLTAEGWRLTGNVFVRGAARMLPLYEAKLVRAYDHRAATFDGVDAAVRFRTHARARPTTDAERADASFRVLPRYWVDEETVAARAGRAGWFMGFRNAISGVADARSLVASVVPRAAVGNSLPLVLGPDARRACLLLAVFNSFVLDYVLRQKASGGNLNFHVLRQLPVPTPAAFAGPCPWETGRTLEEWVVERVLRLACTTAELDTFAQECGHQASPVLDPEARWRLRCDLDAACLHLYGLGRREAEYVLCTFKIFERREVKEYGRPRTRAAILDRLFE